MKNNSTWILLCLACMMTLSCSDKKNTADESEKGVSTVLPDTKNEVAVQILKKRDFHHELVSNGKISARGKADLRFETGEVYYRFHSYTYSVHIRKYAIQKNKHQPARN